MIILLTTPLGLHRFDTDTGRLTSLALGRSEYGGLTWDGTHVYLGHSNIDNASLRTEADYRGATVGEVRGYGPDGAIRVAGGLSQPHQILADRRGRLLIANTGLNRIDAVTLATGERRNVYLNDVTCDVIDTEKAGDHFNGFFEHKDALLVVAHNNGRPSSVWELDAETLGVVRVHETKAEWAHNCWACEHGMVICDSKNGSLYEVHSGEMLWKADEPIITRGLAATDDYIFVGRSEFGNRISRKFSAGGFWVVDRKTLKTVDKYVFPHTGCTIEVRPLDVFDHCHQAPPREGEVVRQLVERPISKRVMARLRLLRFRATGK